MSRKKRMMYSVEDFYPAPLTLAIPNSVVINSLIKREITRHGGIVNYNPEHNYVLVPGVMCLSVDYVLPGNVFHKVWNKETDEEMHTLPSFILENEKYSVEKLVEAIDIWLTNR